MCLALVKLEQVPEGRRIPSLKIVNRELQLFLAPQLAISPRRVPFELVNARHALEERRDALQPISQLGRNWVEVQAPALLEIGKLRDFQAVEHHLPADAPGA